MTLVFSRILEKKKEAGKTWDELHAETGVPLASWMTGLPTTSPSDEDLRKLAPALNTTYEFLKYGK